MLALVIDPIVRCARDPQPLHVLYRPLDYRDGPGVVLVIWGGRDPGGA